MRLSKTTKLSVSMRQQQLKRWELETSLRCSSSSSKVPSLQNILYDILDVLVKTKWRGRTARWPMRNVSNVFEFVSS